MAAWSVTAADPRQPALCQVLDMGPLPGLLQSSYRAEIFAIWRSLCIARLQTEQVHVWTDCGSVVRRLQKILDGHEPKPNSSHSDLWRLVSQCLNDFRPGQVVVHKVTAHQQVSQASSPLEEWCFTHNAFADQTAMAAHRMRPPGFWRLFGQHVNATLACQKISRDVQLTLLAISKAVLRARDLVEEGEREDLGVPMQVTPDDWTPVGQLSIPPAAVRWYGDDVVRQVLSWFWQAVYDSTAELRWVSQFQLYVDFMLSGESAPTNYDGWKHGKHTPHVDLMAFSFLVRARWFSKVLRECLRHHGTKITFRYGRPHSRAVLMHTGCLALPWCQQRLDGVDSWLLSHSATGFHRTSKVMENVPVGSKDDHFMDVWQTCA